MNKADVPQEDLNAYWKDPIDIVLGGFGQYYGYSDVIIDRVCGAIVDWNDDV
jgi:hypothetical protein